MENSLDKIIQNKLEQVITVFDEIQGCSIQRLKNDKLLIASPTPVPWSEGLKPQYNESIFKIGYIMPKKTCLGLYIDFPVDTLTYKEVSQIIDSNNQLYYASQEERVRSRRSWWRYRTGEHFNSIHLVLHLDRLLEYDFDRKELRYLFNKIVVLGKG
ncbi:hypothetical protein [Oceanobacillus saliphilus]|uniref:hypothetical protein n=1 Tax=Oceanobacillus saliphilus TaxID=2925834 RepID=UPI00201E6EA7|nr:hypothetical protein [Oceanobacillus saliphilus]